MTERSERLRERLRDADPEARRVATQEISALPAPESCELLVTALADVDWRVRKEAAIVAARVEPRTAVVFAVARALEEHENIGLRNAAVEALVGIGPDAVPGAIDALGRLDADGRKLAVEVLAGAPTLAGVRAMVRATRDVDSNVVVAAAEGLGRADLAGEVARDEAGGALAELLVKGDTLARVAALDSLRALDVDVPWGDLEPLATHPLLRRKVIAAAGGSQSRRAIRALTEACADANATLATEAVAALGRSLERVWEDPEIVDDVGKMLRASKAARARLTALARSESAAASVRGAALLGLGLVRDPDDVAILADALASDDVADHAEAALRLFGQDAVAPLLHTGRTAAPSLRGATLSMLPQLAPATSEPLAAVREALGDASAEVVVSALKSLSIVGDASDLTAIAPLVDATDARVASAAAAAVLEIAVRAPSAARAMTAADADPRGEGALAAVVTLDGIARAGGATAADAAFLEAALTHREARVRRAAVDALAIASGAAAAPALTLSLADEEDVVVLAAIRALGRTGRAEQLATLAATTKDPLRLGAVLRALKDADPERAFAAARPLLRAAAPAVAAAAVEVVGGTLQSGRVEALMGAAEHPDHEVVKMALAQLATVGGEKAFAALTRAIEHPADAVRRYAAELLGQEGADGEGVLRARLDRERSGEVRGAIMSALRKRAPSDGRSRT